MKILFKVVFFSFLMCISAMFCQSFENESDGIIVTALKEANGVKKLKVEISGNPEKEVKYAGKKMVIKLMN